MHSMHLLAQQGSEWDMRHKSLSNLNSCHQIPKSGTWPLAGASVGFLMKSKMAQYSTIILKTSAYFNAPWRKALRNASASRGDIPDGTQLLWMSVTHLEHTASRRQCGSWAITMMIADASLTVTLSSLHTLRRSGPLTPMKSAVPLQTFSWT